MAGGDGRGGWAGGLVLAVLFSAPLGGALAVWVAQSEVAARGGDTSEGIGFVVPAVLGAAAAVLLVLGVAAVVLVARGDAAQCARLARGLVLVPVVAALPMLVLLLGGSLLAAVLPVVITGVAAVAAWRSARVGLGVLSGFVAVAVTVVSVLGPDAVFLLLPHLLISVGCWVIAAALLVPAARCRAARRT